MTIEEIMQMRVAGATYQEIADVCGVTKQNIHCLVARYLKKEMAGIRGQGFRFVEIENETIREYFMENRRETLTSFATKVGVATYKMRSFLFGDSEVHFTISQIRSICRIVDKPFEEVFWEDETDDQAH